MPLFYVESSEIASLTKIPVEPDEIDLSDKDHHYIFQKENFSNSFSVIEVDSEIPLPDVQVYKVPASILDPILARQDTSVFDRDDDASEPVRIMGATPGVGRDVCDTVTKDLGKNSIFSLFDFTTNTYWRAATLCGLGLGVKASAWQVALPVTAIATLTDMAIQIKSSKNKSYGGAFCDWLYNKEAKKGRGILCSIGIGGMFGAATFGWTFGYEKLGALGAGLGNSLTYAGGSFLSQAWDRYWNKQKDVSLVQAPLATGWRCFVDGTVFGLFGNSSIAGDDLALKLVDSVIAGAATAAAYPAAGIAPSLLAHLSVKCGGSKRTSENLHEPFMPKVESNLSEKAAQASSVASFEKQWNKQKYDRHYNPPVLLVSETGSVNSDTSGNRDTSALKHNSTDSWWSRNCPC